MKKVLLLSLAITFLSSCKENANTEVVNPGVEEAMENDLYDENDEMADIEIMPISHATFVMKWDDQVIYF